MFDAIKLPSAVIRWRLDGPTGAHLDVLVSRLIGAGCAVEAITPATAYRIDGPAALLDAVAGELASVDGFTLDHEAAPADTFRLSFVALRVVAPLLDAMKAQAVETTYLHGSGVKVAIAVARAVDAGLTVTAAGACRWSVSGPPGGMQRAICAALGVPPPEPDPRFPAMPEPRPDVVLPDSEINFNSTGWPDE